MEQHRSLVNSLLDEINLSNLALVNGSNLEYGWQLSSSGRIIRLFEWMEEFGMSAETPEVSWDVDGRVGKVGIMIAGRSVSESPFGGDIIWGLSAIRTLDSTFLVLRFSSHTNRVGKATEGKVFKLDV